MIEARLSRPEPTISRSIDSAARIATLKADAQSRLSIGSKPSSALPLAPQLRSFINNRLWTSLQEGQLDHSLFHIFTENFWVLPSFNEFYQLLSSSIKFLPIISRFYWVLSSFTVFYKIFSSITEFYWVFPGIYQMLSCSTKFNRFFRVWPNFTEFYWVFTRSHVVLPSFTEFFLVFTRCYCVKPERFGSRALNVKTNQVDNCPTHWKWHHWVFVKGDRSKKEDQ